MLKAIKIVLNSFILNNILAKMQFLFDWHKFFKIIISSKYFYDIAKKEILF